MPSSSVSTGSFPPWLAWREEGENHGGVSKLPTEAWGYLQRRHWNSRVLGFRVLQELKREREKSAVLGFPWRRGASYRRPGSAAFIWCVETPVVDRASASPPPSCFLARGRR
jgi:hypothetical protein